MSRPFFAIGVTTYNRPELLKQTLISIQAQTFRDFEVIVGNDFTEDYLSAESIGISDPRIRFVNNLINLQEVGNMNALLATASGRYFTWLADDDLYQPEFLETAYNLIITNGFPSAYFSSYTDLSTINYPDIKSPEKHNITNLSGRNFLVNYLSGNLKIIAVYGLFDRSILVSIVGGIEELCESAVGLYGEYLFLVRNALFDKILYCDAPHILYRVHEGSWGVSNTEFDTYRVAGQELIRRSAEVLDTPSLSVCRASCLLGISGIHMGTFARKIWTDLLSRNDLCLKSICRSLRSLHLEIKNTQHTFVSTGEKHSFGTRIFFLWHQAKWCVIMLAHFLIRRVKSI